MCVCVCSVAIKIDKNANLFTTLQDREWREHKQQRDAVKGGRDSVRGGRSAKEKSREGRGGEGGYGWSNWEEVWREPREWIAMAHETTPPKINMQQWNAHTHTRTPSYTAPVLYPLSSPSPSTHNKWTVRAVKCRKCISKTRLPNSQNICETFRLCGQFCRAAWAWVHIHFELGVNRKGKVGRGVCWLTADRSLASSGKLLVWRC